MFNFAFMIKEDIKEHDSNWPENPDHSYIILIAQDSVSGKTNTLLNLINFETNIDKIYLYAKDLYEWKLKLLISKRKSRDIKYLNHFKAFIECSNDMDDICKSIEA